MDTVGTVTSKGQTTIPKAVRERLNVKPGDKLVWTVEDGRAVVRFKNRSIKELAGYLARPGRKPATLEEIEEAIGKGASASALGDDRPRHKRPA
jgi:AbrB family looped-hinge helix DNA binding protein